MDFDEVVDYIAGFDPAFPQSIVPATEDEIAELEALLSAALPEVYRGFLATMGRDMAWIEIQEIDFSIDAVLTYYRAENWLPADAFIRIGTDPKDPAYHPHLALSPFSDDAEVLLIRAYTAETFAATQFDHGRFQLAGSLPAMVCRPVFEIYELYGPDRRPTRLAEPRWRLNAIAEADALVTGLGFEKLPWSNDAGGCYRRTDAAIELAQLRGHPLSAVVRADQPAEQTLLVERLRAAMPLD